MALGDSSHTAAVVPEMASKLEQLKEQVEKITEMVADLLQMQSPVALIFLLGLAQLDLHSPASLTG